MSDNALVEASHYFATNPNEAGKTLAELDSMTAGVNIAPQYLEFAEIGQKIRGVFMGFVLQDFTDTETGEIKTLECVGIMDADQNVFINAGTSLVGTFKATNLAQYSPVEVTYTEHRKVKRGYMKVYSVRPLIKASEKN